MYSPEIISIEIRPKQFVRIQGIPHDLTQREAERLARAIRAFGCDDTAVVLAGRPLSDLGSDVIV